MVTGEGDMIDSASMTQMQKIPVITQHISLVNCRWICVMTKKSGPLSSFLVPCAMLVMVECRLSLIKGASARSSSENLTGSSSSPRKMPNARSYALGVSLWH